MREAVFFDMGTNEGWPEAFGFSVSGGGPVLISAVEEEGSAQQAGLQTGDIVVELDGVNVEQWTREEVVDRARHSTKVPPSLVVISRVRKFNIPRGIDGGFGITLRGNCPVFIRSVDFHSPARVAGVKSGDLLLDINGESVRFCSKMEVLELLKRTGRVLQVTVVAGGLHSTPLPPPHLPQGKVEKRYEKARAFHSKINYYLLDDETKKSHLLTLLRLYARDHDINTLVSSLDVLLETSIERRLLTDIRTFIHARHHPHFDTLVSFVSSPTNHFLRRGSHDLPRPLASMGRDSPWRSSMPNLAAAAAGGERYVHVDRGRGGFGFTLSGNAPVFIRSVDPQGAAARAGLRPGDQIVELNGLNIRNATHSHVVRLLKGSGTRPTLLVSSPLGGRGRRASAASLMTPTVIKEQSTAFKEKMEHVLLQDERQEVIHQLSQFSQSKDLPSLVQGLGTVLNDPNKMVLFHYVCQLLPEEAQAEFDRIAAALLTGEPNVVKSSGESETVEDLFYRAQSGRLPSEAPRSSRHVATHHFQSARKGGAGMVGGAGMLLEDTPISESLALHDTPIRQVGSPSGDEGPAWRGEGDLNGYEKLGTEEKKALRVKRESLESTPVGQNLAALLGGGTPKRKPSRENQSQEPDTPNTVALNASSISTPGTIPLPPNPPPTPQGGVDGVPVPPPPPPSIPNTTSTMSRLKRVNWEKIHDTEGTIWRELSGLEEALEYCELEKQFASQNTRNAGKAKKSKQPSILDPKKSYNIAILLGHLKMPFERIREAVLACDDTILSEHHLRQLETFAPNKKECLGFARYYDNPSILSLPERFSCEMSSIPCYCERLRAMTFRLHFNNKVDEIQPDLEAISLASVQLQSSKSFKKVLEVVLALGNYMNAGNYRIGGAVGFRIAFLAQLKALRTSDNRSSLLQFLAEVVERKFPQALEFPAELSYTSRAARVSGQTLEVELNELTQGLSNIRRDILEISSQEKLPSDRFEEVMTSFLSEADTQMTDLLRLYGRMKQEYRKVVKFFGEDPTKMRIDDFFGAFTAFITDFEQAVQDTRNSREQEALKERRAKEREELAKKRGSQKVSSRVMTNTAEAQVDLRGKLEAWQSRTINVSSLERARRHSGAAPKQRDFRHVLRQSDHLRKEREGGKKVEERGGGRREEGGERGGRKTERRGEGMTAEKWRVRKVEEKGGERKERKEQRERREERAEESARWSRTAENHHYNELDFDSETQF